MYSIQIEFLTEDEEIIELCKLYWELDEEQKFKFPISSLAKQFGKKTNQLSKFVADYCIAYTEEHNCIVCGKPYVFTNRTNYNKFRPVSYIGWKCQDCVEKERLERIKTQRRLDEQKQFIIRDTFSLDKRKSIDLSSISLENAVFLLALTRMGASEDLNYLRPLKPSSQLLAPSEEYSRKIVHQLYREGLIYIHPDSDPEAFTFEGIKIVQYYPEYVMWTLPLYGEHEGSQQIIFELEEIFRKMKWPDEWNEEWPKLWQTIALEECLQYLDVCMTDHGFDFNPGEKTVLVIKGALTNFSVSQIYNMIWRASKDAAAFFMRQQVTKKHAANTVVGGIQRYSERALAQGWEVKKYGRDRRCPQSLISQVLFNTVLQIGDGGFDEPPPAPK